MAIRRKSVGASFGTEWWLPKWKWHSRKSGRAVVVAVEIVRCRVAALASVNSTTVETIVIVSKSDSEQSMVLNSWHLVVHLKIIVYWMSALAVSHYLMHCIKCSVAQPALPASLAKLNGNK